MKNQKKNKSKKVAKSPQTQAAITKSSALTARVFDIQGKPAGTISLPMEIFGQKPNPKLLAQATRVYQANLSPHTAHTKTRGQVRGGGRKPWRQKGTGNARAGSIRSPLWVGGGITFGPRYRDVKLTLPKKMKRLALAHALSAKATDGQIKIITKLENIKPKTKIVAKILDKLDIKNKTLIITSGKNQNLLLATRNIPTVTTDLVSNLNAYEVLKNHQLLISKEALAKFK